MLKKLRPQSAETGAGRHSGGFGDTLLGTVTPNEEMALWEGRAPGALGWSPHSVQWLNLQQEPRHLWSGKPGGLSLGQNPERREPHILVCTLPMSPAESQSACPQNRHQGRIKLLPKRQSLHLEPNQVYCLLGKNRQKTPWF